MARLDIYLVDKGICRSRERAKAHILAGEVLVNGTTCTRPSHAVSESDTVVLITNPNDFFSRGALKLQKAIDEFGLDFTGKLVLDVGASTGGFTYCALQNGASYVWAVDVGTNQLDSSLRNDPRVCSLEQTDIRVLDPGVLGGPVDIIVADLSFISLTRVAQGLVRFLKPDGIMVLLIKPQFEAGPEHVGKNGVVKERWVHESVVESVTKCFAHFNFYLNSITFAPLKGKGFNIEYLGLFSRKGYTTPNISIVVSTAFENSKDVK